MTDGRAGPRTGNAAATPILLHTCCAPCAVYCLDRLEAEGFETTSFFYNPNIHPYKEFERRLDTLRSYSSMRGFDLIVDDTYDLDQFLRKVVGTGSGRCAECYDMRLRRAAREASERGFGGFTTTLLVSPYQNHDLIAQVGQKAAADHDVEFVYIDFRPGFREGQSKARELGLYRQPYCGCVYSEMERYYRGKHREVQE
ncbi:MAG: epoxyqueuosine reductase QueH [Firmicutes bacterium]|nr:epoxyqueuosine reductase QueH [Bacillota bacterium]